jgi:hypothetical protein
VITIIKDGQAREATHAEEDEFLASIPQPTLNDLKSSRIAAVDAKADVLLSTGYPHASDQHISLTDGSRTDLGAMATTAALAVAGTVPWPESYQQGWITIENTRIPLPTPADGIALAAPVGAYYAGIRQNGRSLKDTILAAEDEAALAVIDVENGWP